MSRWPRYLVGRGGCYCLVGRFNITVIASGFFRRFRDGRPPFSYRGGSPGVRENEWDLRFSLEIVGIGAGPNYRVLELILDLTFPRKVPISYFSQVRREINEVKEGRRRRHSRN